MRLREAGPEDEPRLTDLQLQAPVQSGTFFVMDRRPRFNALLELRGQSRTFVVEAGGSIIGMATALWRPAHDRSSKVTLGELLDVRIVPSARGGRAAYLLLNAVCDTLRTEGADFLFCLIGNHNDAAIRLAGGRAGLPKLQPLEHFAGVNLIALSLPRLPGRSEVTVRAAGPADAPLLRSLIAEQEALERSSAPGAISWPDPTGQNRIWLAFDADGTAAGALVAWDGETVRRIRIMRYRGRDVWLRIATSLLSYPGVTAPLPEPGGVLRFWATRLITVRDGNPSTFRALVAAAVASAAQAGQNIVQVNLPADHPLLSQLAPYPRSTFRLTLYGGALHAGRTLIAEKDDVFYADIARA